MVQKVKTPGSHWWLGVGITMLALGGVIAISESSYSAGHGTSQTSFGLFIAVIGGTVFSVAILMELFSIGLAVRRIEASLQEAGKVLDVRR